MELLEGQTLQSKIGQRALPMETVLDLALQGLRTSRSRAQK
jgi:hypothetical protein